VQNVEGAAVRQFVIQ